MGLSGGEIGQDKLIQECGYGGNIRECSSAKTLIWLCNLATIADESFQQLESWLNTAERVRYLRFIRRPRRRQFLAGRVLLRLALAELLEVGPREISVRERHGNVPELVFPERGQASFSISHSGMWAACVVSLDAVVGLDIECMDPARDIIALAEQVFGHEAAAQLSTLEGAARLDAFYRKWCQYEARIKLGQDSVEDCFFTYPGLMMALSSTQFLDVEPVLIDLLAMVQQVDQIKTSTKSQSTPKSK